MNPFIQNPMQGASQPQPQQPMAPQGGFNEMLNNPAQGIQGAPPQSPQEVQQRKSQWAQMLEDPNAKSALLRMGLTMLQGQRPGETGLGATARAGIGAMDFYAYRNELDRKNALEAKGQELNTRNIESQIGARESDVARADAAESREGTKFEEWTTQSEARKQKVDLEIKALQAAGRTAEAQEKLNAFKIDEAQLYADWVKQNPGAVQEGFAATAAKPGLENAGIQARTRASNAQAQSYKDTAEYQRKKLDAEMSSTLGASDYEGQADFIWRTFEENQKGARPAESLDQFVMENYPQTIGSKGASQVMTGLQQRQALARRQAEGQGGGQETSGAIRRAGTFGPADVAATARDPKAKGLTTEDIIKMFEARGMTYVP